MNIDPWFLLLGAACYIALFFAVAWLAEKGHIPHRLLQHSGLYVFSLGIIVSSWSFYTAYLSASARGYGYNSYYIGFAAAFVFSPLLLWRPAPLYSRPPSLPLWWRLLSVQH
jgi:Na+/proline symporter